MNKKQYILLLVLLLAVVIIGIILISKSKHNNINNSNQSNNYVPEFMSVEEKKEFNIPQDMKVQTLKRSDNGEIKVYKIIRHDWDIVSDINSIK